MLVGCKGRILKLGLGVTTYMLVLISIGTGQNSK
jgi:hypothetical protein